MGIISCKKHGLQGFEEVCEHIDAEYKSVFFRKHNDFSLAELYGIYVCDECWAKHNLDRFQPFSTITSDEFLDMDEEKADSIEQSWSEIYNAVNRKMWCCQCIAEIEIKYARNNGKSDPFPVYEKTLTQLHQEEIDEIENSLIANFEFQKSVSPHNYDQNDLAVFFNAGAYTCPLTIQIYYILSKEKQERIIEFLNNALNRTELNQAKIIFLEAENWIETKNEHIIRSVHRGEEIILRDLSLNC
jgi:hypothetical protein